MSSPATTVRRASVPPLVGDEDARRAWWEARLELLGAEKALTRQRDAVAAARRRLPRLRLEDHYRFDSPDGPVTLGDLFRGRRQLLVFHFMPRFDGETWCPICSFWIDNVGHLAHLRARDTELAVVCPEPLAEGLAWRERMGWDVPWYSCASSSFYDDLHVDLPDAEPDPDVPDDWRDPPGVSAFLREEDGTIAYTYSTYRRGSDLLNGTYNYLDLTGLGRQEADPLDPMGWVRSHDGYGPGDLPDRADAAGSGGSGGSRGSDGCCGGGGAA